ncbi:hypothetical protein [Clostridium sp. KNHs214]|uniref:hypothetical protein n=1 Tax=Clostridium sp. KNHs214 TaxID=1540257 RepID=UPI0016397873|nr:hypothetical protein [Clostridium sp. KNHs214]
MLKLKNTIVTTYHGNVELFFHSRLRCYIIDVEVEKPITGDDYKTNCKDINIICS